MIGPILRKYGVQTTVLFDLYGVTGVDLKTDAAHASGDTKIMKDEGAEANTTNGFTDEGQGYSIVLTATEMQAARIAVYVVDAATKVWLDRVIYIETYGHASAQHQIDFADSVRAGLTALPNAAAEAAGGLYTRGSGAGQINQQANGQVDANVARWLNTAAATPNTAGKPLVDVDLWRGSAPNALQAGRIDGSVGAMAASVLTAAAIDADAITAAKVAADLAAEIADAVWDEALSGHAGAGSTGEALSDAGSAGAPPTAGEVADAVWDEALTGHAGAGSTGERLGHLPNAAAGGNGGVMLADAGGRAKADVERWQGGTPSALQSGRVDVYLGAVASGVIATASFASGALDAVWSTATRLLTAGTNIVLAKGVGVTGFNDPTPGAIADQVWDEALSGHLAGGSTGEALDAAASSGIAGAGALTRTIRILVAGNPLQAATVWLSTDAGGSDVVAGPLVTDSFGIVTVLVDAGTYYVWARKDGYAAVLGSSISVA